MNNHKLQNYFFGALLSITTILIIWVFYPFLGVLALAGVLSVIFHPVFKKINEFFKIDWLSSFIVIVLMAIFIIIPLIFIGWQIFQEAQGLYLNFSDNSMSYINTVNSSIEQPLRNLIPNFSFDIGLYIEKILSWFVDNVGPLVSGAAQTFFNILLTIIALFFFLKDNDKIRKTLIEISPLEDKYDTLILEKLETAIDSVIKGSLLIAVVQGLMAGLGFWAFGVPSPTLWGTVGILASLVPGLGTTLVILPAVIYLFLSGNYLAALGLAIWGAIIVGSMDQILRPLLFKRGVSAHPIFILFAVFGGLTLFGPLGLIFGPVILTFYLTLLEIYRSATKSKE